MFEVAEYIGTIAFAISGFDVIINEVPFVFKTGFYGTVSLLVGFLMYILDYLLVLNVYTTTSVFMLGIAIRIIAYYRKWSIPLV